MAKYDYVKISMTSVAALAVGSTAVYAQTDWTGAYAGLSVSKFDGNFVDGTTYAEIDAAVGGVFLGYNHDFGNFLLGGEVALGGTINGNDGGEYSLENLVDIKAKVGKSFGNTLIYGLVGYSTASDNTFNVNWGSTSGASYGVGVEQKLSDKFSVGLEYLHRNMDTEYNSNGSLSSLSLRGVIRF